MQESSWLWQRARETLQGTRKMGKMDRLAWFYSTTQGLKSRNWIKKNPQNKIIIFLPRTWNSLPNSTEMAVMSFVLHLCLTFRSFPPVPFVLVSTDILGCFPSFFSFFLSNNSLQQFFKKKKKPPNNQTKFKGTNVH